MPNILHPLLTHEVPFKILIFGAPVLAWATWVCEFSSVCSSIYLASALASTLNEVYEL